MKTNDINTSKTPYIKPQLIELNSAIGTMGMTISPKGTDNAESGQRQDMGSRLSS